MKQPSYRKNHQYFTYHNENPKELKSSGDCVVRALSYALFKHWNDVFSSLCDIGFKMKRMPNDDKVYKKYLSDLGYEMISQPRKANNKKFTIKEFAKFEPEGTYIVRTANHLTVVENGKIIDTWDCSDYCVGNYWMIR